MENFALIVLCVVLGWFVAYKNIVPADSHKGLNVWLLYVALPALALRFIPEIQWGIDILLPAFSPLLIWILAYFFITWYSKKKNLDNGTRVALIVTSGLGNTAFLGFPMISAFYGENNIHNAIVYDQMTFFIFSTLAISLVLKNSTNQKVTLAIIMKRILLFPTFIAVLFSLITMPFFDYSFINPFLDKIIATLSPLALFSIGMQIKFGEWKSNLRNITIGLSFRMLIAPLIVTGLMLLFGATGNFAKISIFEAGMPAHISASLLASQYNQNPQLCNLLVGIGILFSFITSGLWYFINNLIF